MPFSPILTAKIRGTIVPNYYRNAERRGWSTTASAQGGKKRSRRLTISKAVPKAVVRNERNTNGHSLFRSLYSDWK